MCHSISPKSIRCLYFVPLSPSAKGNWTILKHNPSPCNSCFWNVNTENNLYFCFCCVCYCGNNHAFLFNYKYCHTNHCERMNAPLIDMFMDSYDPLITPEVEGHPDFGFSSQLSCSFESHSHWEVSIGPNCQLLRKRVEPKTTRWKLFPTLCFSHLLCSPAVLNS